jgi:hypothetical protein
MNKQQMTEALSKCIDNCGIEIINNYKRLHAILGDFLPGSSHKNERMALLHALEIDEWKILLETHNGGQSEHERAVKVILPKLQDVLGWTEERSVFILECYTSAMGWTDVRYSEQVVKPIQQPTQPQPTQSAQPVLDINALKQQLISEIRAEISSGQLVQQPISSPVLTTYPTLPTPKSSYQPTSNAVTNESYTIGSTIKFGSYDWKVLDMQSDKALIISKDVTHVNMPYNKTRTYCTWETCSLRKWLNNDFLGTFSQSEQSRIILSTVINEDNQWYGTKGGKNTQDRIFLLSISEVVKYFGDSGDYRNKRRKNIIGNLVKDGNYVDDQYNKERISNYKNKLVWWRLRSPGLSSDTAAYVGIIGDIGVSGATVNYISDGVGVRPALWVKL